MDFLNRILGKSRPGSKWQVMPDWPIEVDLSRHALCDARLGDPVEWLSKLGPPEDKRALERGEYRYFSKGLTITGEADLIKAFVVMWADATDEGFKPFRGTTVYKGNNVGLSAKTVEQDFIDTFGEPYWRDQDDYEMILFYEFRGNIEWQVEFTLGKTLQTLIVLTPPLMSSEAQRKAYRVTSEWPPRFLQPS